MLGRDRSAKDQELIKAIGVIAKGLAETNNLLKQLAHDNGELARLTAETNKTLKQLAQDNSQFLSTLTSFLAHEDTRRMRKEARDLEDARSKTPTKHDAIY